MKQKRESKLCIFIVAISLISFMLPAGFVLAETPNAPSNLTAAALSFSQIKITWTDNSSDETFFYIERKTGVSGTYSHVATAGENVTTYTDSSVLPNTEYYYRVRAYNSTGYSEYSNDAPATTLSINAPSNLAVSAVSYAQITLTWADNSIEETAFYIERKTGAEGTYSKVASVSANITTYANTGLAQGMEYFYRVRAFSSSNFSPYSNEAGATTLTLNAPSNLTAAALSSSQVKLTWTDNSPDETRFYIERKTGASGTYSTLTSVGADVSTYTNSSLAPNTEYYYRVRAYNGGGYSPYSNEAGATTLTLNAPSNLTAAALSSSQVKLTWTDNSPDETRFYIERKTGVSGTYSTLTSVGANTTTYTDTSVSDNTEYYFRVRAYNGGGYSEYSNEINATTPILPLNDPSNLTATALPSCEINLTWADNSSETNFYIERKTGVSGTYSTLTFVGVNVTTFTDFSVSENTEYYYRVRAYNGNEYSAYSNEAGATTPIMALLSPSNVTAATLSSSQIRLTWIDNSAEEKRFYIERKTGASGTYSYVTYVGANATTYTNSSLAPNTEYYYRVRAWGDGGYSPYSNEAGATTLTLNAPSNLTAAALSYSQIKLTWTDNSSDETGFYIQRKTSASGTYSTVASVGANVTTYTNTNLTHNTEYYYRVSAYNGGGYSEYSNEDDATTPLLILNAPSNLTVTALSSSQIKLTWTDNSAEELYFYIERKTGASGTYSQIKYVGANTTTYTDTCLEPNMEYYYRVRAYNAGAYSSYSNEDGAGATTLTLNAPSDLTAAALSYSQIKLTWTDNSSDEQYFIIERKTGASGTYSGLKSVGGTTYTDTSALENTEYYYRVRAYSCGDSSEYSNEAVAATPPLNLNAPSNLTASTMSSSQIKLTWTDNSAEETRFYIERKTGASGTYSQITYVGANTTTYTNSGLVQNTEYFYRVRAYGAGLYSEYSNEVSATTFSLNAPSDLTAEPISCSEMKLTWTDNSSDETRFYIEYKMEGGTYKNLTYVLGNKTTYTHSGLSPDTKYYYRVRAYGSPNYSPYSNEASDRTILPPGYELHSKKIALVPNASGRYDYGGDLPTSFNCYEPTFVNVSVESIRDNATDPLVSGGYDTVVLVGICDINNFLSNDRFKSRIENFVSNGGKLIIWDSECRGTDYSKFVFPFITSNPGQMGSTGVLADLEENTLSSKDTLSDNYINVSYVGDQTTAVGDANVMVTQDPNWCVDMTAENSNGVTGPVHTYTQYGEGLIIYDGFDKTDLRAGQPIGTENGVQNLGKIWMLELKQAWNPVPEDPETGNSVLPCLFPVVGIQLTPESATTPVNKYHTLTAKVVDETWNPAPGVTVTFTVKSGPHAGTGGTGVTDASGIATFTYKGILAGVDSIEASAALSGNTVKSKTVKNEWIFALTDVRVVDTISNANIAVDELSISPTPYSISQAGDGVEIEWRYPYISIVGIQELSFYVDLLNPIPGEDRLVNQKLSIYYTDVNGNPVITELGPQYVHVLTSDFEGSITTDKPVYQANENVAAAALITNLSEYDRTIDAKVLFEDNQGVLVKEIATLSNLNFTVGETKNFTNLIFNTGSTLAGDYRVHLVLYENQKQVGEAFANFTIAAAKDISSNITTDKMTYFANQPATLTSTITSQSENYIFENLTAKITITDWATGTLLYSETQAIPILMPGQSNEFNTYWNTSVNPPGDYPVTLEVKDSTGNILSTSTTNLTIEATFDPAKLLTGEISVDRQSILQGEPINITYGITNVGNIDLAQIDISIPIVHVVELTPYDTLTDQAALLMGATYANTQTLDTQNYSAKDYLVILRAEIEGAEATLASTYFRVEGAPSAPSLNWPSEAEDIETLTPFLTVNNAADPNDDDLTYEFELYSDSGLANLIASSDTVAETQNTTSWTAPFNLTENNKYYWRARAYDGLLYGNWMMPASFRVNLTNEPPTAPTLSTPADDSDIDTLTPLLVVNNAFDPDSENLTYNFELALDIDFAQIISNEIGIFEGEGLTSWQVPISLNENTYYYWRAQADDWLIEGPWMIPAGFFINTANDAPTAPVIIYPSDGSEITTLYTDVTVQNSTDPDSENLTYIFEIDTVNTFDSADLIISGNIPEGQETTSWHVANLTDNILYYVRAKAGDGLAESPWSEVTSFFVNTLNDPPTTPVLSNPSDGGAVNVLNPELSIHNSTDIDGDVLTYEFELYEDEAMVNLISSVTGVAETPQITSWRVPINLTENQTYYWRARAYDGELYSEWMTPASFMVNTANDAPTAPTLHLPAEGSSVDTLTPSLSVYNATDPDSDILTYDFEIYSSGILIQSITDVPQNVSGITSTALSAALTDNTIYNWRARAYDGDRYGAWMDIASFSIHLPVTNITGTIDFDPDTLNQKSQGKWVVVYIELPQGYNVSDIIVSSILLEGVIPAELWPYSIGDHDKDGITDLMVKFNRADVITLLPVGDNVIVHVTGLVGTTTFEGFDIIRVIH